eukprot:COSAG02_NODE_5577_length_4217_cov_2.366926_1_plen_1095_part_10
MGRQRPATVFSAWEHLRACGAAQQHHQALKRFRRIGNRSAGGTADIFSVTHRVNLSHFNLGTACAVGTGTSRRGSCDSGSTWRARARATRRAAPPRTRAEPRRGVEVQLVMDGNGSGEASEQARLARLLVLRPETEPEPEPLSRSCSCSSPTGGATAGYRIVNGASTPNGLIVSHRHSKQPFGYHADGEYVDVFDPESGCITEDVALADLGDFDPLMPSNSVGMIAGSMRGKSARTRVLLREAIIAFANRPMVGMELEDASLSVNVAATSWRWLTWRDVGLRAENLARALQSRFVPHTFVGICASNSIDWVVVWMAVVLAELVVVPFHATSSFEYASHVAAEARLAVVFADSRTLHVLQDLHLPLCVIDASLAQTTEPSVTNIEELVQQGVTLRKADAEWQSASSCLLQNIRGLVVIKTGTDVEVSIPDEGWVSGTIAAIETSTSSYCVDVRSGQRIVAKAAQLRVCGHRRGKVLQLLQDSDTEALQPEADALATIAVRLAGAEDTAANRANWVPLITRLRPPESSNFQAETADREETLVGLARLWAVDGDTDQGAVWETLALRSGRRAWVNAVLTCIREAIDRSSQLLSTALLDRALEILRSCELVDPRTAAHASDVIMRLDHTMQQDWFNAVAKVETDDLAEGYAYRVLRDADLTQEQTQNNTTVQVTAGAFVHVIQLDGKRAKVRSDFGTGWLSLSVLGEPQHEGMESLMVLYTSGSTGPPKGTLITDYSFLFHVEGRERNTAPQVSDTSFVHVRAGPLSTTGDLHNLWTGLLVGGRVGLIRDSSRLFDVLERLAPDIIACVPQMWAVLHKRFQRREAQCTCDEQLQQLRQEERKLLGHRIHTISTGGAMPSVEVMAWLKRTFPQARVHESYGCTEVGLITKSGPDMLCEISRSCQVQLKDSPPFLTTDRPFPRGAVWVKTPMMAQGYLNRPEETRKSFDSNGFFDTGDIGELISPTQVRLIDRKKSTFKLSNGEWVAPEKIEAVLSTVLEVNQVCVHGSSSAASVVAIVVSDSTPEQLSAAFAQARGSLRHFEIPSQIHVTQEPWTPENGLLTGSHKLNRHAIRRAFGAELNALIDELQRSEADVDLDVAR